MTVVAGGAGWLAPAKMDRRFDRLAVVEAPIRVWLRSRARAVRALSGVKDEADEGTARPLLLVWVRRASALAARVSVTSGETGSCFKGVVATVETARRTAPPLANSTLTVAWVELVAAANLGAALAG